MRAARDSWRLAPVVSWVEANCASVGVGVAAPGTLQVELVVTPELVGRDVLVYVVRPGTAMTGLTSTGDLLGGHCRGIGGAAETEVGLPLLELARQQTRVCGFTGKPVVLEPGSYEVVALGAVGLGTERNAGDLTRSTCSAARSRPRARSGSPPPRSSS